jgi:hypothetical protein
MTFRSSVAAAAALLLSVHGLAAQTAASAGRRVVLVPQLGVVNWSREANDPVMASLAAELPIGSVWSLTAEGTTALDEHLMSMCPNRSGDECIIPTTLRGGVSAGVQVQPVSLWRLAPYVGVSAGFARWMRQDDSGLAPLASVRAGLDLRIVERLGVRANLVRRFAWTETPHGSPLHADVFSIGASVAIGR